MLFWWPPSPTWNLLSCGSLSTTIVCIFGKVYLYIRNICAVKISTSRVCFQLFRDSLLKYEIKNKIILLLYHNSVGFQNLRSKRCCTHTENNLASSGLRISHASGWPRDFGLPRSLPGGTKIALYLRLQTIFTFFATKISKTLSKPSLAICAVKMYNQESCIS